MHSEILSAQNASGEKATGTTRSDTEAVLLQLVAESLSCLFWQTDPDGCNFTYLGHPNQEADKRIREEHWTELVAAEDRTQAFDAWNKAAEENAPFSIEVRVRSSKSGPYSWHLVRMLPLGSAGKPVSGWLGIAVSIQDRKEAEEAFREADLRKEEFFGVLGHELRNPVAAITSAINLLKRTSGTEREEWIKGVLEQQTNRLCRILDDFLDLSRISRGKVHLQREQIRAADVVERAAELVRELMVQRQHEFVLSVPEQQLIVNADPTRLQQILVNLLHNAALYTDKRGRIEFGVQPDGESACFFVRDNGCGIPADVQEKIFERSDGDNSLGRRRGLGIGLRLVKTLTELHGGNVSLTSEGEGKGCDFSVRLPLDHRDAPGEQALLAAPVPPLKILLVEDNPDVATMLALVLEAQHHEVIAVHDGFQALDAVSRTEPDVVLLDIGLPGLNGYEVAKRLRTEKGLTHTLIIATTAYDRDQDKMRSRSSGIDHHLVKPISYETLLPLLRKRRFAGAESAR